MPRQGTRLAAVRGRVSRVTRLDNCGRIVYGEYNHAVSGGIVTAAFTPNTSDNEAVNVVNFANQRRIYEPPVAELAGYALNLTFTDVDFEFFEIITKQPLVFNNGRVVGIEVDTKIKLGEEGFGLETWVGATGGDVCDDPNATGEWGYLLLPYVTGGIMGDFEIGNGAISFTITGASTREGNRWGRGPYAVEMNGTAPGTPGALVQSVSPSAALRLMVTGVEPPEENLGARPVMNSIAAAPTFTAITATEDTGDTTGMTVDFALTPIATGPVYWDFGDGSWDYVTAPGATDHEYEDPGTYTVTATQNGIAVRTVNVTVPM